MDQTKNAIYAISNVPEHGKQNKNTQPHPGESPQTADQAALTISQQCFSVP